MNNYNMKNTIILKDLPSNIAEEAIIIFKSNKYAKKIEKIENKKITYSEKNKEGRKNYIIKEAELLITDYLNKIENKDKYFKVNPKKYKRLKSYSILLSIILFISIIFNIF